MKNAATVTMTATTGRRIRNPAACNARENFHSASTVHGGAEIGAFVLMATIAASFVASWGAYASEYSRYMTAARPRISIQIDERATGRRGMGHASCEVRHVSP